ncbi:MAG: MFS transporter, partial [Vulcanimicrobiaceae bacterium]
MTERPAAGAWGAWSVLREPFFRAVWLADFIQNLGYFSQAVGAGWLMTSLTLNPHVVALVQTASSLPLFILAIPAG